MKKIKILFIIMSLFASYNAANAETVVTTYVTKVQEERKSTRFTLTEWLRIKERMKWMDVWLAMFSKKEEPFKPELNISYYQTAGSLLSSESLNRNITTSGTSAHANLWLTNLVSSTTGIRVVNIDLGLHGGQKNNTFDIGSSALDHPMRSVNYWGGNLRLFGKHIQDSSLSVLGGKLQGNSVAVAEESQNTSPTYEGDTLGANLQLYFWSWLGLEANYRTLTGSYIVDEIKTTLTETDVNYAGFIEISLLRLILGNYTTNLLQESLDTKNSQNEKGIFAGMRLQI